MQKINIHTFPIQDAKILDVCYDYINLVYHDDINDILFCDQTNYPLLNKVKVMSNLSQVKEYLQSSRNNKLIFLDYLEGNATIIDSLSSVGLDKYIDLNQLLVISSGDFENGVFVNLDSFIELTGNNPYNQIIAANNFEKIYEKIDKPYKFLFLNSKPKPHRYRSVQLLKEVGLLHHALWTFIHENQTLPAEYKDPLNGQIKEVYINQTAHNMSWPEGLLFSQLYIDTYFSVVTETNFHIPKDFRTEKIYKPLMIGHPFIVVSNYHFYQGLHNLGFKTFGHLIDESFDDIYDNANRLEKIIATINNLCNSNLQDFLNEAKPICDYNRKHFLEMVGKQTLNNYNCLTNFFNDLINAKTT